MVGRRRRGTTMRHLRASDEVWLPALEKAQRLGLKDGLSGKIREWLVRWVAEDQDPV